MVNVVLVDKHPIVREGLRALLSAADEIKVVADVGSGPEAVREVALHRPDLLIAEVSELTEIKNATRMWPGTALLVFATSADDSSLRAALSAGAHGYIVKSASEQDIIRAIQSVAAGELVFGAPIAGQLPKVLFSDPRNPFRDLTVRQREVAELIVSGMGNAAIARRLQVSAKTVSNHVSTILTKLRLPTRADLAGAAS
jgi:DNA-binding NarL/FixJ family response regulator